MATTINHAIRAVLAQNPEQVIVEDLGHLRGRTKSKRLSRHVSLWTRSILQERWDFKTRARGSRRQAVASAYMSQECSACGFTAKREPARRPFQVPSMWRGRYRRWECGEGHFAAEHGSGDQMVDEERGHQDDLGSALCEENDGGNPSAGCEGRLADLGCAPPLTA
ncbi:MAG: hypothetical protein OWS74_02690 [Firmicutes bacterium]|nr:hypothetical protein [Bacillota bacterium]